MSFFWSEADESAVLMISFSNHTKNESFVRDHPMNISFIQGARDSLIYLTFRDWSLTPWIDDTIFHVTLLTFLLYCYRDFYKTRYVRMDPEDNSELTWPGYMLDKLRVYLSHDRTAEPSNAVFHGVKYEPRHYHGYDNDLNNWQISDNGYLTQGSLRGPKKFYDTSNLEPRHKPDLHYKNHFVHKNTAGLTMHTKNTQAVYHN